MIAVAGSQFVNAVAVAGDNGQRQLHVPNTRPLAQPIPVYVGLI